MRSCCVRYIFIFLIGTGIFLGLAAIADHLILPPLLRSQGEKGLLFPPGSEFQYQTPEFAHSARINSLGFRGREWHVEKAPTTKRILAIGDSFTFGMGVEQDQTWPALLEKRIRADGHAVEIANLGRPGADPAAYADVARRAIPLLKPDIILVAILQGDDLAQTIRQVGTDMRSAPTTFSLQAGHFFRKLARTFFPHSVQILHDWSATKGTFRSKERQLQKIWQDQAQKLAAGYRGERKERFARMGTTAREMFLNGQLNPGFVSMAMADPDYFLTPLQTKRPRVQKGLARMRDLLQEIQRAAGKADVVVLSVPLGLYVSKRSWEEGKEIGFTVTPEMLHTTTPDDSLQEICARAGIPFFSITAQFRKSTATPLYYRYDGHFTPAGHELFTNLLRPWLEKYFFSKND